MSIDYRDFLANEMKRPILCVFPWGTFDWSGEPRWKVIAEVGSCECTTEQLRAIMAVWQEKNLVVGHFENL